MTMTRNEKKMVTDDFDYCDVEEMNVEKMVEMGLIPNYLTTLFAFVEADTCNQDRDDCVVFYKQQHKKINIIYEVVETNNFRKSSIPKSLSFLIVWFSLRFG